MSVKVCEGCGIQLTYATECKLCNIIDTKFCVSCHKGNHLWSPKIKYHNQLMLLFITIITFNGAVLML